MNMNIEQSVDALKKLSAIANKILGIDNIKFIFEFGSRYGEDSMLFAQSYPKATVYAFECNPNTLAICESNTSKYKNIQLTKKAVSDIDGEVSFFKIDQSKTKTTWADGNQGASSLFVASGKYPVEQYVQEEITVESITLSTFIQQNLIPGIDILWMDIQGAELLALKGLKDDISKVKIIQLEVEFFEIYDGQPLYDDLGKFLNSKGFNLLCFSNYGEYSGDAIYVHEHILSGKKLTSYQNLFNDKIQTNYLTRFKNLIERLLQ